MKALSLWQPHAQAIALGIKPYETRAWETKYRGPLVICSAKKPFKYQEYEREYFMDVCARLKRAGCPHYALQYGKALCIVDVVDCVPTAKIRGQITPSHEFWGDFTDGEDGKGRYAFKLENVRRIWPELAVVGRQGFFDVPLPLQLEQDESQRAAVPGPMPRQAQLLFDCL
jgi:activating signal cointegrator 1